MGAERYEDAITELKVMIKKPGIQSEARLLLEHIYSRLDRKPALKKFYEETLEFRGVLEEWEYSINSMADTFRNSAHNFEGWMPFQEAGGIIIEPILEGIHKLVASFNPEFQERLRHNIILSGGGGMLDGLILKLEEGLSSLGGGRVTHVDEPLYAGASGALRLATDMPGEFWEQLQ